MPEVRHELLATAAPAMTTFACPMHPEVASDSPERCPKCGMKLVPAGVVAAAGHEHQATAATGHHQGHDGSGGEEGHEGHHSQGQAT